MDLGFGSDEERFRERVRNFLRENLPPKWGTAEQRLPEGMTQVEFLRDWQRRLHQGGLLGMSWPKEYRGAGGGGAAPRWQSSTRRWRFAARPGRSTRWGSRWPVQRSSRTAPRSRSGATCAKSSTAR